jgi:zinc transport system substrate-binding protein
VAKTRFIALASLALATSCAANGPAAVSHPLQVGASPFALAEVARRVGLNRVVVSDHGALLLHVTNEAWVDPVAMQATTRQVADALSQRDPAGRAAYQTAARAYEAELGSLDIDYRSSLADCGRHDVVTADRAFAPTAARYNFIDHAATDAGVAGLVKADAIPVVFRESGVPGDTIAALARATSTRIDDLDTGTVQTRSGATYLSEMADNLAKLRTALACDAPA